MEGQEADVGEELQEMRRRRLQLHAKLVIADRSDADGGRVLLGACPVGVGTLDHVVEEGILGVFRRVDHPQP